MSHWKQANLLLLAVVAELVTPSPAWAGFSVAASVSGSGSQIEGQYDAGHELREYKAQAQGGFSNYQIGPDGTPAGAKGYGTSMVSRGQVGSGYIRGVVRTDMQAGDLEYPTWVKTFTSLEASAIHDDVVFSGGDSPGSVISTKLNLEFGGVGISSMQPHGSNKLDGFYDNAYGRVFISIGLRDLDNPADEGYEFAGSWDWYFDKPIGSNEYQHIGYGTGLLEDWGGIGGFEYLSLPVDVVVGHHYQFSLGMNLSARTESNGNMLGFSAGDFGHTFKLSDVPFTLPEGMTVNSQQAKIANGLFAGAPAVPEPTGLGLVGIAMTGSLRRRR